jgi:HPt (histidine-containing phosphotransfer) domain-containing protein
MENNADQSAAGERQPWKVPPALAELWDAGQSDVVIELIELFLTDTADRLARLREALATADSDQLRRMAHSIKGSCSQMGEERMALLGCHLEEKAKAESLAECDDILVRLADQFEFSSRSIRAFLEKHR